MLPSGDVTSATVRDAMTVLTADTLRGDWYTRGGTIRWLFSETPEAFYLRVGRLLEDPDVNELLPLECGRLRRLRTARRVNRSSQRAG